MSSLKAVSILILAAFTLSGPGCGPQGAKEQLRPAPSSSLTRADWLNSRVLEAWVTSRPDRTWALVAPTGSMAPYIDSKSILLIEPVTDTKTLRPGDVAHYVRQDGTRVVHTVREVNSRGAVLFSGDNNAGTSSDGWIESNRVWGRTAAVLNTNGN